MNFGNSPDYPLISGPEASEKRVQAAGLFASGKVSETVISGEQGLTEDFIGLACAIAELSLSVWYR
jgi:hypothetical protein